LWLVVEKLLGVSRFQLLSDDQWVLIEDLLPVRTGRQGRPFSDARSMVEGIIYRYRCGIAWRDVPEVFGPWQTIWTWHRRMAGDGTWDRALRRLLAEADAAGVVDWAVSVDSTIARAHQHATNITRDAGGWVELHESARRAA
jgi:putative transposase